MSNAKTNAVTIAAIRNLLNSAFTLLNTLELVQVTNHATADTPSVGQAVPETAVESAAPPAAPVTATEVAAPAPTPAPEVATAAPVAASKIDIVLDMLKDDRFTLRSAKSLMDKAGLADEDDLLDLLAENDVDYVTRVKRGTGETLVGLESRN